MKDSLRINYKGDILGSHKPDFSPPGGLSIAAMQKIPLIPLISRCETIFLFKDQIFPV
jgi:hypothetical protein